jgi:hypothetical protein
MIAQPRGGSRRQNCHASRKRGDPVRCGLSIPSLMPLEYWVPCLPPWLFERWWTSRRGRIRSPSRSAMRPRFCPNLFPRKQREQGMPGARCTRGLVCKSTWKNAHEHTGTVGTLRHSLRNGLTAYAAISPEPNSSGLRRWRIGGWSSSVELTQPPLNLTPATGARTTRFCRTHQRRSSCAANVRSRITALRTTLRA